MVNRGRSVVSWFFAHVKKRKPLCDCRQKAYPIIVINGYFSFGRFWEAMLEGASASWVAVRLNWPWMKSPDWRRPGKGQWAVLYSWTRLWSSLDGLFVTQISCTFSGMVVTQPESTVLWTGSHTVFRRGCSENTGKCMGRLQKSCLFYSALSVAYRYNSCWCIL